MTYAHDLVSWEAAEPLGKVPGSDWLCPQYGVESLEMAHAWGPVTDADVQLLAAGRAQHLMLYRYPEGQHYVEAVDSDTGKVLTHPDDLQRYDSLERSTFRYVNAFSSTYPLPLGVGYELRGVEGYGDEGVRTTVQGAQVPESQPDCLYRRRSRMRVLPAAHKLDIEAHSASNVLPDAIAMLKISQTMCDAQAVLRIERLDDAHTLYGGLRLCMDTSGQAVRVGVHGCYRGEPLGLPDVGAGAAGEMQYIDDTVMRGRILDAFARAVGFDRWRGLDLRMTASGLYQAMAARDYSVTNVLVSAA